MREPDTGSDDGECRACDRDERVGDENEDRERDDGQGSLHDQPLASGEAHIGPLQSSRETALELPTVEQAARDLQCGARHVSGADARRLLPAAGLRPRTEAVRGEHLLSPAPPTERAVVGLQQAHDRERQPDEDSEQAQPENHAVGEEARRGGAVRHDDGGAGPELGTGVRPRVHLQRDDLAGALRRSRHVQDDTGGEDACGLGERRPQVDVLLGRQNAAPAGVGDAR